MSAKLRAVVTLIGELTGVADLSIPKDTLHYPITRVFTNGTGINQINNWWHDQRTIAGSADDDLDLSGGITNSLGQTLALAKVKLIAVIPASGNPNTILLGPAAANGFLGPWADASDRCNCEPNGVELKINPSAAGWGVTAGTGDVLRLTNPGAGNVVYDIIIAGSE